MPAFYPKGCGFLFATAFIKRQVGVVEKLKHQGTAGSSHWFSRFQRQNSFDPPGWVNSQASGSQGLMGPKRQAKLALDAFLGHQFGWALEPWTVGGILPPTMVVVGKHFAVLLKIPS